MAIATNVTLICDSNPNNSHLKNFTKIQERLIYTKKLLLNRIVGLELMQQYLGVLKLVNIV